MLESYAGENFNSNAFVKGIMEKYSMTRTQAMSFLRKKIPRESYYQEKIKKAIKKRYPTAFVAKIAQGSYSQAGIPDIMAIIDGHYFGFEIKRPLLGSLSEVQRRTLAWIRAAGGTAEVVTWPEECFRVIDAWKQEQ